MKLKDASQDVTRLAKSLSGTDIGATIRFGYRSKNGIATQVTAELRQVHHNGAETVLDIAPHDMESQGGLDQRVLDPNATVEIFS